MVGLEYSMGRFSLLDVQDEASAQEPANPANKWRKEYTTEELLELIESIDGDFMIHIRLEDCDEQDEGSV